MPSGYRVKYANGIVLAFPAAATLWQALVVHDVIAVLAKLVIVVATGWPPSRAGEALG